MTTETVKHSDDEQLRESLNTMRVLGGLCLAVALLLYFFHLGEAPLGGHWMSLASLLLALTGGGLLWRGQTQLRHFE